ncbi:MAG TPA: hydroxymethylbilane synthase [Hyphomicrobiales bacterium]|nr:hydroxymethylbilane synthase [Hyphomicrobiales bacterium]
MSLPFLRLGTRGSPLALWQADAVAAALARTHNLPAESIERVVVRTSGDRIRDRPLADAGGKGLFTKELDEALLDGRIDLAAHSAKDVPSFLTDGIALGGCLDREDSRDALVAPRHLRFDRLPAGAVVGTASVRRAALIRHRRPDLGTVLLRGNVGTRLRKVAEGECDATVLALAGLRRLGREAAADEVLDPAIFPPALAQGIVAVTVRAGDERVAPLVAAASHLPTLTVLNAERALLAALDGSCRTPIAGGATLAGDRLHLRGLVIAPDGSALWEAESEAAAGEAGALGARLGAELLGRVPAAVLRQG